MKLREFTRAKVINPKLVKNMSIEVVFKRPRIRCSLSFAVRKKTNRDFMIIGKMTINPNRFLKNATSKGCNSAVLMRTRTCIIAAKKVEAIIKIILLKNAGCLYQISAIGKNNFIILVTTYRRS